MLEIRHPNSAGLALTCKPSNFVFRLVLERINQMSMGHSPPTLASWFFDSSRSMAPSLGGVKS